MIIEKNKANHLSFILGEKSDGTSPEVQFGMASLSSELKKYARGEYVYEIGEASRYIYLIESGCVKVAKMSEPGTEVVKSIIGKGHVFGEKALTGERHRKAYAQSVADDTTVHVYNVEDVLNNSISDPALNMSILGMFGKKIEMLEKRIESIISKDSRTRIVEFLRELAEENGKKVGFETLVKNNYTHKDIASLTGTSRQTVTTTLNSLKDQNIINFDRRRILIRDMDLLK